MKIDPEHYQQIVAEIEEIKAGRQEWDTVYRDLSDYVCPRQGRYADSGDGDPSRLTDRDNGILDKTATRALRVLAAGMQGGLTSPARPWFRLSLEDRDMAKWGPVKTWIDTTQRILYSALSRSNFYLSAHSIYTELAAFGAGCQFMIADGSQVFRFRAHTAGEYYLATDHRGVVDTVLRELWFTNRNMVDKFGEENVSRGVKEALRDQKNRHAWARVWHLVRPRVYLDGERIDNKAMPYQSVYIEESGETDEVLLDSGFLRCPFQCPRWNVSGSAVYGDSPGMDVLPDVQQLQEMSFTQLKQLQMMADPPLKVPTMLRGHVQMIPGAHIYVDGSRAEGLSPLYQPAPAAIAPTTARIQDLRQAVREGLFNDMFLMMLERPNMTATEVAERHQEKLLMLGPVIERQINEYLDPTLELGIEILAMSGMLPEPPQEIQGAPMKYEYISTLAQAQKAAGTQAVGQVLGLVNGMVQVSPHVRHKIDAFATIDEFAEMVGAPSRMVRSDDDASKIAQAEAEAAQQAQQAQQGLMAAQRAKTLSEADTSGDNALTRSMA